MVWSLKKPWLTSNHPLMSLSSPLSPLLDNRLSILLSFGPVTNSMIMAMDQVSLIIMRDVCSNEGKWWNSAEFMWGILKGVIMWREDAPDIGGWMVGGYWGGTDGISGQEWYPMVSSSGGGDPGGRKQGQGSFQPFKVLGLPYPPHVDICHWPCWI